MNKLFLIPVLGLLLAACTHDASADANQSVGGGNEGTQFLSVSLVSAGAGTRADNTNEPNFKDGTTAENEVTKVRFYFFTATGEPAAVKKAINDETKYLSFYDWTPEGEWTNNPEDKNVEKIASATIVIDTKGNKDKIPYSVVAVLNPYEGLTDDNLSLSALNEVYKDYNTSAFTAQGKFVMSNSVHLDGAGQVVEAIPVVAHIRSTKEDALAAPVKIYVERVVARLDLKVEITEAKGADGSALAGLYDTGFEEVLDDMDPATTDAKTKVYVKFLGWNLTATTDNAWLMKRINSNWNTSASESNLFGKAAEPWNDVLRFRSYWAINYDNVKFNYGNFGVALPEDANPDNLTFAASEYNTANAKEFNGTPVYMQENAAKANDGMQEATDYTKVIIAAQLVDKDNKPLTLAEWGFNYYTVDGLKKLYAQNLDVYKSTANGKAKIEPDDITFITAGQLKPTEYAPDASGRAPQTGGRYYVYPTIKAELDKSDVKWYFSLAENADEKTFADAKAEVEKMAPAKIWNSGYTYYYFGIEHLGAANHAGEYGVVRNHIYDTTIGGVKGLGTPVYDPNETIYPEHPDDDNSMIAAQINILSWRIVSKRIQLSW